MTIYDTLSSNIGDMEGDWVVPKNAYEKQFCDLLGWECVNNRYYDAITPSGKYIEIKKGQGSMWYDMVRYAEIFLGIGEQNTVTVFLRWSKKKKRVTEIYIIDTVAILNFLKMDSAKAHTCILYKNDAPRGLNMLASMTALDMKKVALKVIYNPKEYPNGAKANFEQTPSNTAEWKRMVSKTTGLPYWMNVIDSRTTWVNPYTFTPWRPVISKRSGKTFWWNQTTNESKWKKPEYGTINDYDRLDILNGRKPANSPQSSICLKCDDDI